MDVEMLSGEGNLSHYRGLLRRVKLLEDVHIVQQNKALGQPINLSLRQGFLL